MFSLVYLVCRWFSCKGQRKKEPDLCDCSWCIDVKSGHEWDIVLGGLWMANLNSMVKIITP